MSAVDQITGLIPITMAAGVTMAVTKQMFPSQRNPRKRKSGSKRSKATRAIKLPGNYSNVGF